MTEARSTLIPDTLTHEHFLVIDTETTGLGDEAEICEIAIINDLGNVLLNSKVKPVYGIPADATAVHGISDADVAHAPPLWVVLTEDVLRAIRRRHIVIYNADYDLRILRQSAAAVGRYDIVSEAMRATVRTHCLMEIYAEHWGAWSEYHQSYTWQSLENAAAQQGLEWDGDPHSALADARMTLRLLRHLQGGPDDQ